MKLLVLMLALSSTVLLMALIYALIYAPHESSFWKYRTVIGIFFIASTRFAVLFYRKFKTMN